MHFRMAQLVLYSVLINPRRRAVASQLGDLMKKSYAATLVALGLTVAAPAMANPIPTITPDSPLLIQFSDLEQFSASNSISVPGGGTEGNWGIVNITSINLSSVIQANRLIGGTNGALFTDVVGHTNGQISGIFYGVQITSPTTATGGFLDLYWDSTGAGTPATVCDTGTALPTSRTSQTQFTGCTDGIQLLHLAFDWGVVDSNTDVFLQSDVQPSSTVVNGTANGFFNVLPGGAWASIFNTNYFHVGGAFDTLGTCTSGGVTTAGPCPAETRDFRFRDNFNGISGGPLASWSGPGDIVGLTSTDPVTTFSAPTVPEPSALALMAIGLIGFAVSRLRKT
jgi:hypothetical protein